MRTVTRNDDPPEQFEGPCDVCGNVIDDCICPECPNCGGQGDPHCYRPGSDCGLVRTQAQIDGRAALEVAWRAEAEGEAMYEEMRVVIECFGFAERIVNAMSDKERRRWCERAVDVPRDQWWLYRELGHEWP